MAASAREERICSCGTRLARDNLSDRCSACVRSLQRTSRFGHAAVSPEFWTDRVIQKALAKEHMGRLFRAWRTHPGHAKKITQEQAAEWLRVDQGYLSRAETCYTTANWPLERLRQFAAVMAIPSDLLWFSTNGEPAVMASPGAAELLVSHVPEMLVDPSGHGRTPWDAATTIELAADLAREDLQVDRREATRQIVGFLAGGVLLEQVEQWLAPGSGLPERGRKRRIGHQEVELIEHDAVAFRSWDHHYGGGLRRRAVIGQLTDVAEELRNFSHPPDLTQRLFGVMSRLAECAATMSWDSGDGPLAQRYYLTALRSAREAGDREFGANILAAMARQLYYLNKPTEGLELVRLAQDGLGGGADPLIMSMLSTREAWAYALQGRVAAFRRTTSKAEDTFDAGASGEGPDWIQYFDEAELAGVTGGRLLELAHQQPALADEAATLITKAIEARPADVLRSSSLDRLGLVEVRLIQRELDEAAALGHAAAAVVERTQSDRARVKSGRSTT